MDAKDTFTSVTLRMIIATAFGEQFDASWMEVRWRTILKTLGKYVVTQSIVGPLADWLPWSAPFKKAMSEINQKCKPFIEQRRQMPAENQSRSDIVGLLVQAGETDDTLILDEARSFLVAGHETTSNMLSWCCYFLYIHPDVQEKTYQEVKEVLGERTLTSEDIPKMKYIKAVLEETLRLRPSFPSLLRSASKEVTLFGKKFPAGTRFAASIWAAHFSEDNWKNPKDFYPERFLENGKDFRRHPWSFIPFSAGFRNCLGQKFAMQEGIIIMSSILQKFRITGNGIVKKILFPIAPEGTSLTFVPLENVKV